MVSTDKVSKKLQSKSRVVVEEVKIICKALDAKKAITPRVLEMSELVDYTDYFVIASGETSRHTQSLADYVIEEASKAGFSPHHTEGYRVGEWILIDFGDLVVHIFQEEKRKFYDLERLWRDAPEVTKEFL